jgi:hypothetical protein
MSFKKYTCFILLVSLALSACKKTTNPPSPQPIDVDVYVAGSVNIQNSTIATYWKNGQLNKLPGESNECVANAIILDGKDLYLAGYVTMPGNTYSKYVAAYWKNGVKINLPDSALDSKANAIAVSGSDIYVAGYRMFSSSQLTATYWKNGVPVSLPDSLYGSEASAIAVNSSDVYIAGYIISPKGHHVATLWKNGAVINLDNSGVSSGANAIALSGNDLYIAGFSGTNAIYWKNGVVTKLMYEDATSVGAGASAIAINGADVYVAGGTYNDNGYPIAIYWKNGVGKRVPNSTVISQTPNDLSISQARGIAVNGSDVYVSGFNLGGQAVYWKNGTTVQLGFGPSNAGSILLVPRSSVQ